MNNSKDLLNQKIKEIEVVISILCTLCNSGNHCIENEKKINLIF